MLENCCVKSGKVSGILAMANVVCDEYWRNTWVKGQIGFHMQEVNPTLIQYVDEMTAGQEKCRIFVPLCGKSKDLKWLADRGHTVVGAELFSIAIKDVFKESNMEYSSSSVKGLDDAELYTSKHSSILVYKANIFDLNREILGEFDCIWDRASLVAIPREDIQRYADLMRSLLKPNGRCLLATVEYDRSKMNPSPFSTPLDTVEQLYASDFDIKLLEVNDGLNDKWRSRGLNAFTERTQLLTKLDK